MKFLIDLTSLSPENTGVEYVAENAALSLIEFNKNDTFILVFNDYVPNKFKDFENLENFQFIRLKTSNWNYLRIFKLPKVIRKANAEFNLFFAFPCPYFAPHKNSISLIHDLTAFKYSKTQTWIQNFKWRKLIRKSIKHDKHILSVSDTVKYEIANYFSRGDIKRIYPGVKTPVNSKENAILSTNNLVPKKFILSVATYEPRKNLQILIDAYQDLTDEDACELKLVIVGKQGWKSKITSKNPNVVFLDYQNDEALSELYRNAKLFISPSIYEGFGLPVIEAIKHDCPVLVSDIPIYHETTNNNALYFNCNDKEDLKNKINESLKYDSLKPKINDFNWQTYGEELSNFLTNKNKVLHLTTSNLLRNSGYKLRVLQCYDGLENFHSIDKYVGNSNVNFYVMKIRDIFSAIIYGQCSIKHKDFKRVKKLLKSGCYSTIFIDNSLYGKLYKQIKKQFPKVKTITHFHNHEIKYFNDLLNFNNTNKFNLMSKLSLRMVEDSEAYAAKFSDELVFISDEDASSFKNYIDKSYVVPPCIPDLFSQFSTSNVDGDYVVFVGSNFYANIQAVDFLIEKVAPHINKKIIILGDDLITRYQDLPNVIFKSYNNNAEKIFSNALAFVSPVFTGSGSKIKIAEALMWGKKIIASEFSLIGYDYSDADIKVCFDAQDFIEEINKCNSTDKYSETNRNLYLKKYNTEANRSYFKNIG